MPAVGAGDVFYHGQPDAVPRRRLIEAHAALNASGIRVPAIDLAKTLTQGDVVAIGNAAGLNLNSSSPSDTFDADQLGSFMVSFGPELGASDPEVGTDDADLDGFEADLDAVDAALEALDADDLDTAESLAASLTADHGAPADETDPPAAPAAPAD